MVTCSASAVKTFLLYSILFCIGYCCLVGKCYTDNICWKTSLHWGKKWGCIVCPHRCGGRCFSEVLPNLFACASWWEENTIQLFNQGFYSHSFLCSVLFSQNFKQFSHTMKEQNYMFFASLCLFCILSAKCSNTMFLCYLLK